MHKLAKNKQLLQITSDFNKQGLLEKILHVFNEKNIDLYFIEGKVIEKDSKGYEKCRYEVSFDNSKPNSLQQLMDSIKDLKLSCTAVNPP